MTTIAIQLHALTGKNGRGALHDFITFNYNSVLFGNFPWRQIPCRPCMQYGVADPNICSQLFGSACSAVNSTETHEKVEDVRLAQDTLAKACRVCFAH